MSKKDEDINRTESKTLVHMTRKILRLETRGQKGIFTSTGKARERYPEFAILGQRDAAHDSEHGHVFELMFDYIVSLKLLLLFVCIFKSL